MTIQELYELSSKEAAIELYKKIIMERRQEIDDVQGIDEI